MKLRQKLAMVLASAMIVTAVPVVTMAASTNSFNRTITVMKDDILDSTTDLGLKINLDEKLGTTTTTESETFYVESTDFEFMPVEYGVAATATTVTVNGVTIDFLGLSEGKTKQLRVTLTGAGEDKFEMPVRGKVTGSTPTIIVDGDGTIVSSNKYPIMGEGTVAEKALVATVGDAKSISVDGIGTIADITIEEVVAGALNGTTVTIELDRGSDLVFAGATQTVTVEGKRGLAGEITTATLTRDADDHEVATITFSGLTATDKGAVVIKGIEVEAEEARDGVPTGEVEATITAKKATKENMAELEEVVANVNESGVKLTVKDDEVVEFVAGGEKKEVVFTLEELTAGSLDDRDRVYFKVEGADIVSIDGKTVDQFVTSGKGYDATATAGDTESKLTYDKDDKEFTLSLDSIDEDAISKYEVKVELVATPGSTDDIVVTAESKAFDDTEVTVGTVELDRTFDVEVANLVVGTRGQEAGSIVIEEDAEEVFQKGQYMIVALEDDADQDDISLVDFEVEADDESGLEVKKVDLYEDKDGNFVFSKTENQDGTKDNAKATNAVAIEVTRESDEAGTITLENFKFNTNNSTPDGTYKVTLTGTLVSQESGKIEKDFVVVGEGTESQAEVVLQVGNAEYTVDGEAVAAEIAPFIDPETNRTMAPVRAVAEAFGCELDFYFPAGSDQLVINMTKGDKLVQFQNGSNIMTVNGGDFIMSATAQIKDGHTFVPVAFLAQALNIDYTWDGATQTIVFGN